jgi:3-hydroxyacyl-[acyl-carrier-protein] dehydratase
MCSDKSVFCQNLMISQQHPSLAGHFPDNPVVPGVVILDQVIQLWQSETQKTVQTILNAKFVSLLKPEQPCTIEYQKKDPNKVNFLILNNSQQIIAKGLFTYVE